MDVRDIYMYYLLVKGARDDSGSEEGRRWCGVSLDRLKYIYIYMYVFIGN